MYIIYHTGTHCQLSIIIICNVCTCVYVCSVGYKTGSSTASDERTAEYSGSVTQNQVSRSTAPRGSRTIGCVKHAIYEKCFTLYVYTLSLSTQLSSVVMREGRREDRSSSSSPTELETEGGQLTNRTREIATHTTTRKAGSVYHLRSLAGFNDINDVSLYLPLRVSAKSTT